MVVWIEHGGTVAWLPQMPDLTPLNFCVWGYIKDKVFVPPFLASLEELRTRIAEAIVAIDADMIHRIQDKITYRWDICHVT